MTGDFSVEVKDRVCAEILWGEQSCPSRPLSALGEAMTPDRFTRLSIACGDVLVRLRLMRELSAFENQSGPDQSPF